MTDNTVSVLDHGHVRLVDHMGNDLSIVRAARVSYNAEWRSGESCDKDTKLIHYLLKNRHTSPFEHVVFTFDIKCPIFIARQWHRHRTWSFNEVSARYTELPGEFYVPDPDHIGVQSTDNKQVREMSGGTQSALSNQIWTASTAAFKEYRLLLAAGCPREIARSVLPLNTYTHFFGTIDLHNLMHFLTLRLPPHAQWEIRQYAQALFDLALPVAPAAMNAYSLVHGGNHE